jgi:hypothetical protein
VALPISGGFSGSPVPDPLREYVTLIVSAGAVGAAQMLSAKAQATAGRKVLMSTLHILSGSDSYQNPRGHQGQRNLL